MAIGLASLTTKARCRRRTAVPRPEDRAVVALSCQHKAPMGHYQRTPLEDRFIPKRAARAAVTKFLTELWSFCSRRLIQEFYDANSCPLSLLRSGRSVQTHGTSSGRTIHLREVWPHGPCGWYELRVFLPKMRRTELVTDPYGCESDSQN